MTKSSGTQVVLLLLSFFPCDIKSKGSSKSSSGSSFSLTRGSIGSSGGGVYFPLYYGESHELTETEKIVVGSVVGGTVALAAAGIGAAAAAGYYVEKKAAREEEKKAAKSQKDTTTFGQFLRNNELDPVQRLNSEELHDDGLKLVEERLLEVDGDTAKQSILAAYHQSLMGLVQKAVDGTFAPLDADAANVIKLIEQAIKDDPDNFAYSIEVVNFICQYHGWTDSEGKFPTDSRNVDIEKFAKALAKNDPEKARTAVSRDPGALQQFADWFRHHRSLNISA